MNKFITLALFAICATMAHGQVIWPAQNVMGYNGQQQNSASGSNAAASASSSSSSDSANSQQQQSGQNILGYPAIGNIGYGQIVGASPYGNVLAAPQGWVNPIVNPWVQQYPSIGLRNVGPCNQGILY